MSLLSFWKNAREEVLSLNIEQVVANAGDGNLRDSSASSQELRDFLSVVPVEKLFDYARHCRESAFSKSGLVLQDVVNELGAGWNLMLRTDFTKASGTQWDLTAFG